jgi:hypothetical protein
MIALQPCQKPMVPYNLENSGCQTTLKENRAQQNWSTISNQTQTETNTNPKTN